MTFRRNLDLGLLMNPEQGIEIALEDGQLHYFTSIFSEDEADALFANCLTGIPWQQDAISIAGRVIQIPRLQCWLGSPEAYYSYSNLEMKPQAWPPFLMKVKQQLESLAGTNFNSALANYYRDGRDSVDWHSDDETELGDWPIIASLSLGVSRVFELKHRTKRLLGTKKILLQHGSVLIMKGGTQRNWRHRIAKVKNLCEPRINLTFRRIVTTRGQFTK